MPSYPSRWYRSLHDESDIIDFANHLKQLGQFKIIDREYPAQIHIHGEAYYILKVIYEAQKKELIKSIIKIFMSHGDVLKMYAEKLGSIFLQYITSSSDTAKSKAEYIYSIYMVMTDDTGSSATLNYWDVISIDNNYWEPKGTY